MLRMCFRCTIVFLCTVHCVTGQTQNYRESLVSRNKAVNLSSTLEYPGNHFWEATYAVDGNTNQLPNTCRCCAASANQAINSTFTLNLENKYLVSKIEIYGRADDILTGDLTKTVVYLNNDATTSGPIQMTSNYSYSVYETIPSQRHQYVIVETTDVKFLIICEIQIYARVCNDGYYGDCSSQCGQCANNQPCNKISGVCLNGCNPGYQGNMCVTECPDYYFGDCQTPCGNCKGPGVCNKTTGYCPRGCSAGFQGLKCKDECPAGFYGENCFEICGNCKGSEVCDRLLGHCTDCEPGYTGLPCKTPCEWGKYGEDCLSSCGHCWNNNTCNITTGFCDNGCAAGYTGYYCNKICDGGRYGPNCLETCGNCKNNQTCDIYSGYCTDGCAAGYKGSVCKTACDAGRYGRNCGETCGYCKNNQTCDIYSGYCTDGCAAGYKGSVCKTECSHARFGLNCSYTCNCYLNASCNHISGICENKLCSAGWRKQSCDQECSHARFGQNCTNTFNCYTNASCNHITGVCENKLCSPGWREQSCYQECSHASFGLNCTNTCNCYNNASCNHITGVCANKLCSAGWKGDSCSIICDKHTYGQNCSNTCHCKDDADCDPISGDCSNKLCDPGWKENSCSIACTNKTFGDNCTEICNCISDCHHIHGNCTVGGCVDGWTGTTCTVRLLPPPDEDGSSPIPIVVAVVAVIVLCAIVVVIVFFIRRRRMNKGNTKQIVGTSKFNQTQMAERRRQEKSFTFTDKGSEDSNYHDIEAFYENTCQKGIKTHELWNYIKLKSRDNCTEFLEEYRSIPLKVDEPTTAAVLPCNSRKNRFKEIYPYDENRVQLTKSNGGGDYINASYIDGVGHLRKYIASQGPNEALVDDFWRMIWEKKVLKIVMLTNIYENDSRRGFQYWSNEQVMDFGKLSITVTGFVKTDDYDIRDIRITQEGGRTHDVKQFHFKSWPDKDVPVTTWSLVHFWRKVNETITPKQPGKIVVHCSTGVGRTGTYIALDCLYNEALLRGEIKPIENLRRLRQQRPCMVQTKEQYVFLHEALADALNFGTHHVLRSQFEQIYLYMTGKQDETNKSRLKLQYELIVESLDLPIFEQTTALHYESIESVHTYANAYGPSSGSWNSENYQEFEAVVLKSYTGENGFITCKLPTHNRMGDFWKTVTEANIKTVVIVHERSKLKSPNTSIRLFEFPRWKPGHVTPNETSSLLPFLDSIMTRQPKVKMAKPILVCCSDGASQSGLICVLLNELYRMRETDGQINLVESVKIMKHRNRRIIPDFAQYKFCYDVIREACSRSQEATYSGDPTYVNE